MPTTLPPSDESFRFRVGSLAKQWMGAVVLQVERLSHRDTQSWAPDVHFLIEALVRLHGAARLGMELPSVREMIGPAILHFERAVPDLMFIRRGFEDLERPFGQRGPQDDGRCYSLHSGVFDGESVEWLSIHEEDSPSGSGTARSYGWRRVVLNIPAAFQAANELSRVLQSLHPETQST